MPRIYPSGRILRRPVQPSRPQQVSQEPTSQQTANQEKEFYSKRGGEQSTKLEATIKNKQDRVKVLTKNLQTQRPEAQDKTAERIAKLEDTIDSLMNQRGKASSGKYNYQSLVNYAQERGEYKFSKFKYKQQQKQAIVSEPKSKEISEEQSFLKSEEAKLRAAGMTNTQAKNIAKSTWEKFQINPEARKFKRFIIGREGAVALPSGERGTVSADISFDTPISEVERPRQVKQYFKSDIKLPSVSDQSMWSVNVAPTTGETYKRYVKDRGYVSGTLGFIGGKVSSYAWRGQERSAKKYGGKYDPQIAELSGSAAEIAPYFTPVGPYIFAASGAESFISPSGRERIENRKTQYEELGLGPFMASSAAWAEPTLELGIGYFGIKSSLSKIKLKSDLKKSTTEFIAEETSLTPEMSRVSVLSKTKIGKKTVAGISQQDVLKFGDQYSFGVTRGYLIPKGKPSLSFPRGKFSFTEDVFPIKAASFGRVVGGARRKIPKTPKGKIDAFAQTDYGRGVLGKSFGNVYTSPGFTQSFEQVTVGGFKRVGESSLYTFTGGAPSKLRISKSKISYIAKPSIKGLFYKTPKKQVKKFYFDVSPTKNILKSQQVSKASQVSAVSQASVLSKSAKASIVTKPTPIGKVGLADLSLKIKPQTTQVGSSLVTSVSKRQKVFQIQSPSVMQKIKTKTISDTLSKTKTGQRYTQLTAPVQLFKPAQKTRYVTLQATKQTQVGGSGKSFTIPFTPRFIPTPGFPFVPLIPFGLKRRPPLIQNTSQGYIPQAKSKGGKWLDLSRKPLSRSAALSRGSRAVDNTLSAQFRVKKAKGKISKGLGYYFGATQRKYRPYKIRKGRKVGLINHYIEKRGSRIDTFGEKSGLKLAKFAKNRGWLAPIKRRKKK